MAIQSPKAAVSGLWRDYAPWFFLMLGAYVLFSFRKVFTSLGDPAGDPVAGGVATTQAAAAVKVAQTKVQTATGSTKTTYTPAQLAQFEQDATTLANYLGQGNFGLSSVFKNQKDAFGLIKGHYARLNLFNNKPWYKKINAKAKAGFDVVPQTKETSASVKNAVNYKVLIPFYKDVTDGRDLVSDYRYFVTDKAYNDLAKWIL